VAIVALTGVGTAARDVTRPSRAIVQLVRAGLVDAFEVGGKLYLGPGALDDVARSETVEPDEPAMVVRVGPAVVVADDPTRTHMGWSADLSVEQRRAGVDRWWRFNSKTIELGRTVFVVTVGSMIVEAGRLMDIEAAPAPGFGLGRAIVEWDDNDGYPTGHWLNTGPGGPVVHVGTA
jgi:hypothetical protein